MRLTVGPLPAAVYWRRRAAVILAIGLIVTAFAATCGSHGGRTAPDAIPSGGTTAPTTGTTPTTTGPATDTGLSPSTTGSTLPTGIDEPGAGSPTGDTAPDRPRGDAPPVVATVECTDDELLLTAAASPTPARYSGSVTLMLIVRNTADHPCFRDVGSAPQELQVRQGEALLWSSDSCGQPQTSDVRTFGPNIESRFWRTWNTYRMVPHECETPPAATPAAAGTYQVVARLGTKLSEPTSFEIRV